MTEHELKTLLSTVTPPDETARRDRPARARGTARAPALISGSISAKVR